MFEFILYLCGDTGNSCENPHMIEGTDLCCCNGINLSVAQVVIKIVKTPIA